MEVCSSTETGAPGASHFGNGRSRTQKRPKQTTISPGKRASVPRSPSVRRRAPDRQCAHRHRISTDMWVSRKTSATGRALRSFIIGSFLILHLSLMGKEKRVCEGSSRLVREKTKARLCDRILSMVCDKECLILLHRLRQFLKISLSELSGQKICPAIRMHRILHHSLVVIR